MSVSAPPLHGPSVALGATTARRETGRRAARARRLGLRSVALGYLAVLLIGPVAMIFYRTFEHGVGAVWTALMAPNAQHAFWLSLEIAAIAVPLNTVFGIGAALLLERGRFRGRSVLGLLIDLPFAISPVVVGLTLVLVYGKTGWLGGWLTEHGLQVIFSVPGMVMATAVVSLPFVARETMPVLRELGTDSEQAAATLGAGPWQTFWRVTLPAIRWGVVYGVVLTTARALGEFGAVLVVGGAISGKTQTATTFIYAASEERQEAAAFGMALVLAILSMLLLIVLERLKNRGKTT